MGHPKLGLSSIYEGKYIWEYFRLLKIKSLVYIDALLVILSVPLVDKPQTLTVYKIPNLSILLPELCKCLQYNIQNDFIVITANWLYITYPYVNKILNCQLSAGHYCEINTPFYPIDNTHHCSYYLLQNNDDKVRQFCSLSVVNQTKDQAFSLDYYYWAITTMRSFKLHVVCLTSLYYIKLKFPIDIIHVPDTCKAYINTFFLPARIVLAKK